MRPILSLLIVFGLVVAPAMASKIYRTTDDEGNVVYTDDPPGDDAEPVELEPLTTVPGPSTDEEAAADDAPQASKSKQQKKKNAVTGIRVVYPKNDKGIRHNGGNVPVRVALEPEGAALPKGQRVEIVLDGEVRGRGRGEEIVVSGVIRGPHTVYARLVDARGNTRFQSESVKFFLLRKALGGSD